MAKNKLTNPFLMTDFYKISHHLMSEEGIEKTYCTFTPRGSRIKVIDSIVSFGLQRFIKKYLIDYFNDNFFNVDKDTVVSEYKRIITASLGAKYSKTQHIEDLYDLGYLPLEIKAIDEGINVNMRIPVFTVENTDPRFGWLPTFLETLISCEMWKPPTSATIAREYRRLIDRYCELTCDTNIMSQWQCHNFSYRGMAGHDDATICGLGHLLYSTGTDTIPSIQEAEFYYGANVDNELIGASVLASEHSIQTQYQDDYKYLKRMLTEVAPEGILSLVIDGYDYWNVMTNIIPSLKEEILARDGKFVSRGDSGDPVDIICGTNSDIITITSYDDLMDFFYEADEEKEIRFIYDNVCYILNGRMYTIRGYIRDCGSEGRFDWKDLAECVNAYGYLQVDKNYNPDTPEAKGSIEVLWDIFGGTVNSKGYKLLDPHVGYIYGDAITPERLKEICEKLMAKGFASENVVIGAGSYSLGYYSRDTFSMAFKATCVTINGVDIPIFKNPKTDDGTKKSAKGKVVVIEENGKQVLIDGLVTSDLSKYDDVNLLKPVFRDGKLLREVTLAEIRARIS